MKISRLFILFFLLAEICWSQENGVLKGMVADTSGQGLPGASLFLLANKNTGTATDYQGNYFLSLSPGTHTVICAFTGMQNDTFSVEIKENTVAVRNVKLIEEPKQLETVVVSSGKFDQKIEDLTVSMEVLRPNIIQNKNTTSIENALQQVPGLTILDNDPQIRGGSGFTFGVGSRVAIVVDGMSLLSGDAGRPEWGFIPVENIEQVEVVKGASSVLYGSSALSGVINIRTAYPRSKPKTSITYNTGIYSNPGPGSDSWYGKNLPIYGGLNLFHSRIIKNNLDFVVASSLFYDMGYIGPPKITSPKVKDSLTPFTNDDLKKYRGRINFNLRYRSKKVSGLSYGLNGNAMFSRTNFVLAWLDDSTNLYRAYPGAISLQDQTIFNVDPFIKYSKNGVNHSLQGRIFHTDNVITNKQSNKATVFYGEYQLQRKWDNIPDFTFTGGVVTSAAISQAKLYSGYGQPDNQIINASGYAQLDKKLWKVLNISAGFRYEYFEMNKQTSVVKPIFRMGASLKVLRGTFVRYSYGQGFRFPTITERFILTNVGSFGVFPNKDLVPETSTNSEIGVKQVFKVGKFKGYVDAAGFYQEYQNTIEYLFGIWSPSVAPVGFKFLNTGNSRVRGLDISIAGRTDEKAKWVVSVLGGYTFVEPVCLTPHYVYATDSAYSGPRQISYTFSSMDTTNYTLKYRFKHSGKIDIEVRRKKLLVGYSCRFYSRVQNIDKAFEELEAITQALNILQDIYATKYWKNSRGPIIHDLRIAYAFNEKHRVSLVVNNLMNTIYSLRPMKIEAPRTTAIQYNFTF